MNASIRETIRQRRPFASPQVESLLTLLRATDVVGERAHAPVRGAGLSVPQYNVLRILRGAGPDGLQTYEVADRMVARAPNITRLVDKLEAKGLLTRTRSSTDRRVVRLTITAAGLDLLASLDAAVDESCMASMAGLEPSELRELCRLLDRLREPLETRWAGPER